MLLFLRVRRAGSIVPSIRPIGCRRWSVVLFNNDGSAAATIGSIWRACFVVTFARGAVAGEIRDETGVKECNDLTCDRVALGPRETCPWIQ